MKYNDNGEYKDIYVKAFDTLPVGTEVDYDGNEVPNGWSANNNVLWTNPSPTSNFAGQSVTLSEAIENFSEYEVIYKRQASANTFISSGKLPITSRNRIDLANGYLYSRAISTLSGTTLTFGDCSYYATYGNTNTTTDNSTLIPYMVIGYKGRIKKTSQYLEGGAKLSNEYGTSQSDGYSQEYINNSMSNFSKVFEINDAGTYKIASNRYTGFFVFSTLGGNRICNYCLNSGASVTSYDLIGTSQSLTFTNVSTSVFTFVLPASSRLNILGPNNLTLEKID